MHASTSLPQIHRSIPNAITLFRIVMNADNNRMPLSKHFTDTWAWGDAAEDACRHLIVGEGGQVGATIQGLQQFLNETPMMAYLRDDGCQDR